MTSAPPAPPPAATARPESATEELARRLDGAEAQRLRALSFEDLRRLARLYRRQSARLSRLRDRDGDRDEIAHLNALCVRAHGLLYSARRRKPVRGRLWQDLHQGLATSGALIRLAWALMAVGALVGFWLVRLDPSSLYALMPAGLGYDATQIDTLYGSAAARDLFFARDDTPITQNAVFGSYLFSHNTRIGILAFASGILAGLPTLLLQFYNGIMVGTISAIFLQGDHALLFSAWILPHGVPELTAITLCSAAGLALGRAVAAPGRKTRSEALRSAGPTALALFLTSVPLFLAAAWIESFVRESALGTAPRLGIAAGTAIVLSAAALLVRRPRPARRDDLDWLDDLLEAPADAAPPDQTVP